MPFPAVPDAHGIAVLVLIVVALALFTRETLPLETSSLTILVLLVAGFELFPYANENEAVHAMDFFSGFGHEALVAVCALMIAGQGIVRTGALEPVGRSLAKLWSVSPHLSFLLTLIVGAVLSAFVNNVPIVVLLLPILISISLRTGGNASDHLMPMGFATLIGGMSTTIGTSTNLLVISVAAELGLRHFGMFDFAIPATIVGVIALIYLWLIAPRLLPKRQPPLGDVSPRLFSGHLLIEEGGFSDGKSLSELLNEAGNNLKVREISRAPGLIMQPFPDLVLKSGDRLNVWDTPANLKEYEDVLGTTLYAGSDPVDDEHPLTAEDQQIAEIVVTQGSPLQGTTLAQARFADRYQLVTLALHRAGNKIEILQDRVSDIRLRIGDILLVQGPGDQIKAMKSKGDLLVLDATSDLPTTKKAPLALAVVFGIVLTAALGILPIAISATCGVLLLLVTRCLRWQDAADALSIPIIMIVVASLALGKALLATGGADYLAQLFVYVADGSSPTIILSGLMLVMAVLTNIVSNNAAAVIGTPISISIAGQLGLPAEPFVLAVLFGANMSFATPMAYKTNLLVMNAGGYQFMDFVRVGVPLTILMWLSLTWLLPTLYGL